MSDSNAKDFSKSFMYSIHQMHFLVQKHLEQALLHKSTISFSQFMVLVGLECSRSKTVSQSEIASCLYITEATVSRHMRTLVEHGLLSKSENTENRRKHIVSITPKGKKVFQEANKLIEKELEAIFSVIGKPDRSKIINNFSLVLNQLLTKK